MTEKVKVSKKVAVAIDAALADIQSNKAILMVHEDAGKWTEEFEPLNTLDFDTLARAIYIGFEVVQTPEEKVEEYYKKLLYSDDKHCKIMALSVRHTLSLLKIRIKGVNA